MLVTLMERHQFDLSGGDLALDFANTVDGTRTTAHQRSDKEHLRSYGDVLEWAVQAGVVSEAERRRLARAAAQRGDGGAAMHRRAIDLREAIFSAFDARAHGRPEPEDALASVDREARIAAAHRTLTRRDGSVGYVWSDGDDLDRPLWPVAAAAADLLVTPEVPVVKECASETCDWLFVDRSRNRSRRWCDMSDCGNRAKARRFYARRRAAP